MISTATPPVRTPAAIPITVVAAATIRSLRTLLRSPALLIGPLAQSLFFLLVYTGQLSAVGESYLPGGSFIAFLLPLILVTGVATGAGAAGTLIHQDVSSGYLDRLRMAHGTSAPFIAGTLVATLVVVAFQQVVTVAGAMLVGYRPGTLSGMVAMLGLMIVLGLAVALFAAALAVRGASASSMNLVTLVVFGLSFFTGFFAPVEQLSGWMRAVATINPVTYLVETARDLESGVTLEVAPIAAVVLVTLLVAGALACVLSSNHARRTR